MDDFRRLLEAAEVGEVNEKGFIDVFSPFLLEYERPLLAQEVRREMQKYRARRRDDVVHHEDDWFRE